MVVPVVAVLSVLMMAQTVVTVGRILAAAVLAYVLHVISCDNSINNFKFNSVRQFETIYDAKCQTLTPLQFQ